MNSGLAHELSQLPVLYSACEELLGHQPRRVGERVRGSLPKDIRLHEGALAVRTDILAVLASWAGLLTAERQMPGPAERSVPVLVAFLRTHLEWLLGHPAAADFAAEIRELTAAARAVVEPDDARRRRLGDCDVDGCGQPVWATMRPSETVRVRCDRGHDRPVHTWLILRGVA